MLRGLNQLMERKEGGGMYLLWVPLIGDVRTLMMDEAHASRYLVQSGADNMYYDLRDMYGGHVWRRIFLPMLPRSSSGYDTNWVIVDRLSKEGALHVIIRVFDVPYLKRGMEGSVGHMFFGLKLKKFGRLDQNWYKRQQIRVEVGDKVMLEVTSWKDVYLANTNLHVHLEEIKVDKTLHFVEEPVEIINREVKSLKRSRIPIVSPLELEAESCYTTICTLVWASEVVSSGFPIKLNEIQIKSRDEISLRRGYCDNCALSRFGMPPPVQCPTYTFCFSESTKSFPILYRLNLTWIHVNTILVLPHDQGITLLVTRIHTWKILHTTSPSSAIPTPALNEPPVPP
ncbi:hypothetical protein Tco_0449911 [Tanacetum coccineum]